MNRWQRSLVAIVATASLAAAPARADEVIDRVLAVVRGEIILLSDVRVARELSLVPVPADAEPDRAALAALIDRALMLDEVRRYAPPEPPAADVDKALADVKNRQSAEAFASALSRSGLDERRLREHLRQDLRIRAYIAQRFGGDAPDRTQAAVDEWLSGLRRRGGILDLSRSPVAP